MNLGKENETLEFKETTAEFDKACKAISAMLNKKGEGVIYFGVKDNGEVIGQIIGKDTLSTLTDRIKDSIKPTIYPLVESLEIEEKKVIRITVKGNNKPYAYKGAFYMRVEQQNLPLDPLVLREMVKNSTEFDDSWEKELTNFGMDHVDIDSVERFYKQAVATGRIQDFKHNSEDLLVQLGLIINGKLTKAGYYLFGTDVSLVYKAVHYPTTERLNPIDLKRYEGNVFNLIFYITSFINEHMMWNVEFDGMKRIEKPEVPVVAIREIIINSLVHSDFFGDTEHQITFDPEVIEIYNPGNFTKYNPEDYIKENLPSRTRHKIIQGILYKAFDIETMGRGLKRMNALCLKDGVKWSYKKFDDGFMFYFNRKKSGNSNSGESIKAMQIYDYMTKNNGILKSIKQCCDALNLKSRSAYTAIEELINLDKIERIGSRKSGYWKIK